MARARKAAVWVLRHGAARWIPPQQGSRHEISGQLGQVGRGEGAQHQALGRQSGDHGVMASSSQGKPRGIGQRRVTARAGRGRVELVGPGRPHERSPRLPPHDLHPLLTGFLVVDMGGELPGGRANRVRPPAPDRRGPGPPSGCATAAARVLRARAGPCPGFQPRPMFRGEPVRNLAAWRSDSPRTLSPSKMASFTACPLAFRFSLIDTARAAFAPRRAGHLVHTALEGLFWKLPRDAGPTPPSQLVHAWVGAGDGPEFASGAERRGRGGFLEDARHSWATTSLRTPTRPGSVGVELGVEIDPERPAPGHHRPAGLAAGGNWSSSTTRTGRAPSSGTSKALTGVHIYALLCERCWARSPAEVRLLHLREPMTREAATAQTVRGQRMRTAAVWTAIERACARRISVPWVRPVVQGLQLSSRSAPPSPPRHDLSRL